MGWQERMRSRFQRAVDGESDIAVHALGTSGRFSPEEPCWYFISPAKGERDGKPIGHLMATAHQVDQRTAKVMLAGIAASLGLERVVIGRATDCGCRDAGDAVLQDAEEMRIVLQPPGRKGTAS